MTEYNPIPPTSPGPVRPTPAPPGPARRLVRTICQVVIAVGAAVPAAVALLPIDTETALAAGGIAGCAVILVSALQNGLNDVRGTG